MSTKFVGIDDGHGEIKVCFGFDSETGRLRNENEKPRMTPE